MGILQRRAKALAAVLCLSSICASAWAGDAVVDEVIRLAKEKALNRAVPDWPLVEREVQTIVESTLGEDGRTAAIRHVLASLQDQHSSYRPPTRTAQTQSGRDVATAAARPPIAVAVVHSGGVGTLVINGWAGNNERVASAAQTVRTALIKALSTSSCGLVIDVSANQGGNMWPMMGGIAPLYDEGVLETFESPDGKRSAVNVNDGVLRMNDSPFPNVELTPLMRWPGRIALVMGRKTASSGEILALGFKGQKNVRFFGQPTAGATTANTSMKLLNGGLLALTTSRILDRSGTAHAGPVLPDVYTDEPAEAARTWAASGCN